jgi:hypothetical protein
VLICFDLQSEEEEATPKLLEGVVNDRVCLKKVLQDLINPKVIRHQRCDSGTG